jgi:hypothetical protein
MCYHDVFVITGSTAVPVPELHAISGARGKITNTSSLSFIDVPNAEFLLPTLTGMRCPITQSDLVRLM